MDNGTIYYVYGGISDCLSRFNPSTNVLHVVYGGVEGNDLQFYIELKLKSFDVKFHKIDNELFNLDGYSDIAYNNSMAITSSIYTPEDFVKNGVTYTFKNWTYYDGNYENDVANNEMDEDNFKVLTSINWEFNGEKGALHLFANWYKLFNVGYFTDVTDGIDVEVIVNVEEFSPRL